MGLEESVGELIDVLAGCVPGRRVMMAELVLSFVELPLLFVMVFHDAAPSLRGIQRCR